MTFPTNLPSYTPFVTPITLADMHHTTRHKAMEADILSIATKAGIGASTPVAGTVLAGNGDGVSVWEDDITLKTISLTDALSTNIISEKTPAAGVTIDGVKLKDSQVYTDIIVEKTAGNGVVVDGMTIKDGGMESTSIGKIGDQPLDSVTNTAAKWAALPVGYSRMFNSSIGTAGGAPVNNYGYFTKIAHRDTGGGWSGLWCGYEAGQNYIGRTAVSSSFANWDTLYSSANLTTLLALIYPVGCIYTSTSSTNPATTFGFGTWAAFGAGRVLVGKAASGTFATGGATGGNENVSLAVNQLPSMGFTVAHTEYGDSLYTGTNISHQRTNGNGSTGTNDAANRANVNAGAWHSYTWGSGNTHTNLQPYVVVYMWQRTA